MQLVNETITIWDNLKKLRSWSYPYSLGLLYSAVTQYLGFKPNEEEYIVMGMSAFENQDIIMSISYMKTIIEV